MKRRRNHQLGVQRFALGLLGLVLLAGGGAALLLTQEVVAQIGPWAQADEPLLVVELDQAIDADRIWYQLGAFGAGLALALVGLAWLRSQVPPRRIHQDQDLAPSSGDVEGSNSVRGGALAEALEADLARHPMVEKAVAEVRAEEGIVRLRLDVDDRLPAEELAAEVVDPAVGRSVTIVGTEAPQVLTDVRLVEATRAVA